MSLRGVDLLDLRRAWRLQWRLWVFLVESENDLLGSGLPRIVTDLHIVVLGVYLDVLDAV